MHWKGSAGDETRREAEALAGRVAGRRSQPVEGDEGDALEALRHRRSGRTARQLRRRRRFPRRGLSRALAAERRAARLALIALMALVAVGAAIAIPRLLVLGGTSDDELVEPAVPEEMTDSTLAPSTVAHPPLALAPPPSTVALAPSTTAPPACPLVDALLAADTDGDGCPELLRYDAGVLRSGTVSWAVGADGDQVATGDWRCRGQHDLALLQVATGDVFVFDGWAGAGIDVTAAAVARVDGAFALRAAELGSATCQRLVVERRNGAPVTVPVVPAGD